MTQIFRKFAKNIILFIKSDNPPKVFFKYYLVIVLAGAILLKLPFATNNSITFLDALFTATSAVSVTGLIVVNTAEVFSLAGQIIILILIVCGGLGLMAIKGALYMFLRLKINTKDRKLIMNEQQHQSTSGMAKLVKQIIIIAFIVQFTGAIALGMNFYLSYDYSLVKSIWNGIFHSVSAVNNAGFDIFGNSLYSFQHDYIIQTIFIILIIFGGIGFPVIIEVSLYIKNKFSNNPRTFCVSLFTKITVSFYFAILLIGFLFIFIIEYNNGLNNPDFNILDKIYIALFQSVTTRNAGFATTDLSTFSAATILVMTTMMFIGAAPSSTGGGIRTTTFAVVLIDIYNKLKGKNNVEAYKRQIPNKIVQKAYLTTVLGTIIIIMATVLILVFNRDLATVDTLFEVTSAFGTTGLSTGITETLTSLSRLVIIAVMFTGQIGISTMLGVFITEKKDVKGYKYGEEQVLVG